MTDQTQSVIENIDQMIPLITKLFFNKKDHVAQQIYRHWLDKPYWGYKPISIHGRLDTLIYEHLLGENTLGFYSHSLSATCKWLCIDIDLKIGCLGDRMDSVATVLGMIVQRLSDMGIPQEAVLMEFSGSKGFHVWVMINETPMPLCQNFIRHFLHGLEKLPYDATLGENIVALDKFPYPTTDPDKCKYGYAVKIPCGLHKKVRKYSQFVDINRKPVMDVPALLDSIVPCELPTMPELPIWEKPRNSQKPKKQADGAARKKAHAPIVGGVLPQPTLMPELNALFTECPFMKHFKARPDLAGYREWTHAGQILIPLGSCGIEWFEYLSSIDQRRFDGSHQLLIDNVLHGGLSAPRCGTIGCTLCHRDHPYQILDTTRKRYSLKYKTDKEPMVEEIDLVDLRQEYKDTVKAMVLNAHAPKTILSTMPVGGYKTTTIVDLIKEEGVRIVYYCPNHTLAEDIQKRLHGKATIIKGLDRMVADDEIECPHAQDILESQKCGRSAGYYCNKRDGKCSKRSTCPYLKQFTKAARAKVVILVHNHLHIGNKKWSQIYNGKQLAVLDESFHRQYRTTSIITRRELNILKSVLMKEVNHEPVRDMIEPLLYMLDSHHCSMTVPPTYIQPTKFLAIDQCYRENHPTIKNPLRELMRAGHEHLTIRKIDHNTMQVNLPARLPHDIPILILDATAREEDYQRLLGRPIEEINPAKGKRLKQYAHIVQVLSGAYPNSSLFEKNKKDEFIVPHKLTETGERIVTWALNQIRDHHDYGIICTQMLQKYLKHEKGIPPHRIMHFNLLRGMNDFRDVRDLIIIGYQGISYEDMAKSSRILFDQDWDDKMMEADMVNQKSQYSIESNDSRSCKVKFLMPKNPYIDSFHRLCVLGEVEQAVGRARIYSKSEKTDRRVHIITNAPTSVRIDEFVELSFKDDPVKDAAQELLSIKGEFTFEELYDKLQETHTMTHKTARKHLKALEAELNLIRHPGPHNVLTYAVSGKLYAIAPALDEEEAVA